MDKLRRFLGIRRIDKLPNEVVFINVRIDEGVLRWCGHVERMENDRIAKMIYVGECAHSHSVARPQRMWIEAMNDCLK